MIVSKQPKFVPKQPKFQFGEEVFHTVEMQCCENSMITQAFSMMFTVVGITLDANGYSYTLSHGGASINNVPERMLTDGK